MAITELDVHAAADALLREGERPTIERVRLKLGRGSPNTITGFLNSWFAGLGERLSGASHATLPEPVARLSQELWRAALEHAREQVQARQSEEAGRLAAERDRLAAREQELTQAQDRLQAREADLELGLQALRQQLDAAQHTARAASDELRVQQRQAATVREALTQALDDTQALRAQLVEVQNRHADVLAETQARHAAQERRWLNELDAERQANKRLTAEIERARHAAERARGEMQTEIASLQEELRQVLRGETTLRAELAATSARLEAEQAASRAAAAVADKREAELLLSMSELSARMVSKDRQLDALTRSLAPRRNSRRGDAAT